MPTAGCSFVLDVPFSVFWNFSSCTHQPHFSSLDLIDHWAFGALQLNHREFGSLPFYTGLDSFITDSIQINAICFYSGFQDIHTTFFNICRNFTETLKSQLHRLLHPSFDTTNSPIHYPTKTDRFFSFPSLFLLQGYPSQVNSIPTPPCQNSFN
jgi:hypothetical protein